jgi:hypothetical protein
VKCTEYSELDDAKPSAVQSRLGKVETTIKWSPVVSDFMSDLFGWSCKSADRLHSNGIRSPLAHSILQTSLLKYVKQQSHGKCPRHASRSFDAACILQQIRFILFDELGCVSEEARPSQDMGMQVRLSLFGKSESLFQQNPSQW